ncbi:sensor histidine kinase [Arcobacter roscoffensis]|uniref:histidine kinase n=1 Tax=Arcobacter roscoffensis TaxID=2961520 RepID=A0ABY5E5Y7_9BACT|nr:HAMP domain-containing sensor histidine kinase [Arcobacter roscoffensis]UTJ07576.1 HAMP domain-containing histidine kinase [Arcobacter roscoffensis]
MKNRILYILLLLMFIICSVSYFWWGYTKYVPHKVNEVGKNFITNESVRHILKVSILNEKAYNLAIEGFLKSDEDLIYDSVDYLEGSLGFLSAFELREYKDIDKLKTHVLNSISILEENLLNIDPQNRKNLFDNKQEVNKIVERIEKIKWKQLHKQIVLDESKKFEIMVILVYTLVSILILFAILIYIFKKKSLLEQEKTRDQKLLLNQSKIAAIGEMLGNIAHQWRQPLSVITTLASGTKFSLEINNELKKEELIQASDNIIKQANYLSKTIDDFRSFFMADNESMSIISIKKVIRDLESLTQNIFENNFIKTQITIDKNHDLYSNESILIQAFINICNNAKDAFKQKEINTENRYFFIDIKQKDKNLEIEFLDSAQGIKEEVITKIFEPYFTTKHKSLGTGIGLYMSHELISKYCKGTISVANHEYTHENKKLKGAKFTVVIPL